MSKPKSVNTAIIVAEYPWGVPPEILRVMDKECFNDRSVDGIIGAKHPRTLANSYDGLIISPTSLLFGAIHVAAWAFHFPSAVDMWIWRVASCISALALLVGNAGYHLNATFNGSSTGFVGLCCAWVLYTVARFVLMVEMIRTLFYLPSGAFISTWAAGFPHIG